MSADVPFEYCPACRKRFKSKPTLSVHMKTQHWRNEPLTCTDCGAEHYDSAALSKCKKRHQGMFQCCELDCKFKSRSMAGVKTHLKAKHGVADPQNDDISFDPRLAKAAPPKTRPPRSFLKYRNMSKEELAAESARIRLEELGKSAAPSPVIQEGPTAPQPVAMFGYSQNTSYWIDGAHGATAELQSSLYPPIIPLPSAQCMPSATSYSQMHPFQGPSQYYTPSSWFPKPW